MYGIQVMREISLSVTVLTVSILSRVWGGSPSQLVRTIAVSGQLQGLHGYLLSAQIEGVGVQQELRLVIELWRELFDITAAVQAVVPGGWHIGEEAVCMVKPAALQLPVHAGEGLHADQVEQHHACTTDRSDITETRSYYAGFSSRSCV